MFESENLIGELHFSAFLIRHRECFSTTKSVGIIPKEYIYNVNSEILEDLYAKKFTI